MPDDEAQKGRIFAALIESSPDGYLAVHRDWRFVFLNPAAQRILGIDTGILGRTLWEAWPQVAGSAFDGHLRAVMEDHVPRSFSLPSVLMPRHYVRLSVFWYGDGIAVRFRDVTEDHLLEERHQKALAELEAIYQFAPIGLALLDAELRYLKINDALAEINGRPAEDHLGRSIEEIVPQLAPQARPIFLRAISEAKPILGIELAGVKPGSSERRTWLAHISPILGDDGRVRALLVTVADVTAQKQTEEKLRTALEAQKLLHREIVHRVANNFQMVGSVLRLQARRTEPAAAEVISATARRIQAMGLVHRKLYSSQHEIGTSELVGFLRELSHDLAETLVVPENQRSLVFESDEQIKLDIDRTVKIGIVVTELVTNAFKYAYKPNEKGVVTVAVSRQGPEIVVSVRDQGRGLPDDLDIEHSPGLGMTIALAQAQQLGCKLHVERREPGTEFRLHISR